MKEVVLISGMTWEEFYKGERSIFNSVAANPIFSKLVSLGPNELTEVEFRELKEMLDKKGINMSGCQTHNDLFEIATTITSKSIALLN